MSHAILICVDDLDICGALKRALRRHEVTTISSRRAARAATTQQRFAAVISELCPGAEPDLAVLHHLRMTYPDTRQSPATGHRDVELAARRSGLAGGG